MTAYFCAITVHCGHGWNKQSKKFGCNKTAYIETGHTTATRLLQHELEWFCSEHKNEQVDDLSGMTIKEI